MSISVSVLGALFILHKKFYCGAALRTKFNLGQKESNTGNDIIQVVGITLPQRKIYVSRLETGDELDIVREQNNEYDSRAIRVNDLQGHQVGYFARDCNCIYAPKMDMGFRYKIHVVAKEAKIIQCKIQLSNVDEMILPEVFC